MVLAFSRFRVANGMEDSVRGAFLARPHLVDNEPGFLGLEVFSDKQDPAIFYLLTRWTDEAAFSVWHRGQKHKDAHGGIPKGLKLDPSYTLIRTAERISAPAGDVPRSEQIMDTAPVVAAFAASTQAMCWLRASLDGTVLSANTAFEAALGREGDPLTGSSLWSMVTDADAELLRSRITTQDRRFHKKVFLNFLDRDGSPRTLGMHVDVQQDGVLMIGEATVNDEAHMRDELLALNNQLAVLIRENERKTRALEAAKRELETATKELQDSYWHIRKIHEVLPVCMMCGKVKTENLGWENVLDFLKRHSRFLSHGYCPTCTEKAREAFWTPREEAQRNESAK